MLPLADFVLFVSHVSEDRAAALEIVAKLESRGIRCWVAPRDVSAGSPFDAQIDRALEHCRAMLLVFSEHCIENNYIRREVTVAGELEKIIVPFRIENVKLRGALRVRLSDLHWYNGFPSRDKAIDEVARLFASGSATVPVDPLEPPSSNIETTQRKSVLMITILAALAVSGIAGATWIGRGYFTDAPSRATNVTAAESTFIRSKAEAMALQNALGVKADGDLGPAGAAPLGSTRLAISEYNTGLLRRAGQSGVGSDVMDGNASAYRALIASGTMAASGLKSPFERGLLGDQPSCISIGRAITAVNGPVIGGVPTPEKCMDILRLAIADRRTDPRMPKPLGDANALDSALFDRGQADDRKNENPPDPSRFTSGYCYQQVGHLSLQRYSVHCHLTKAACDEARGKDTPASPTLSACQFVSLGDFQWAPARGYGGSWYSSQATAAYGSPFPQLPK